MPNLTITPGSAPEGKEGNQRKSVVSDPNAEGTLQSILKQLKIMNIHLSMMTDQIINESEVE